MRLLLVAQDFPPEIGGIQTYGFELARRLAPLCERFTVLAPKVPGDAEFDRRAQFEVVRAGSGSDGLAAQALWHVARLGRASAWDVVFHTHWATLPAGLVARSLGAASRVVVAVHGRELLFCPVRARTAAAAYGLFRRRALARADHVVAVSRYTASLAARLGVAPERLSVVANGTDPDRFAGPDEPNFLRAQGLEGHRIVLTASRLVARKGVDLVLRALPGVLSRHPDVRYVVVGDGPERARLERLASDLGLGDRVRFTGRVNDAVLKAWLGACELFVAAPRHVEPDVEGFGLVFVEASAAGKPVVATRSGGVPDAVEDGETGFLVEPERPNAIESALAKLLERPDLARRLGRNGRARVVRELNWDRAARELQRVLAAPHAS